MKPSQLKTFLTAAIVARKPILIKGAPGIGKTDIVVQAAAAAHAELVLTHPVVSDPTDYKGLPGIVEGKAEFLPYGMLRNLIAAKKPTVCFFDDLGQAPASVQAAIMQLLLAREIDGHKISEHVTFIAATNRREDRAGVNGMLEPVKSRFTSIVELEVDLDEWVHWALDNDLPPELIAFIKFRPGMLHDFKASSDLINSPCPRTVANAGHIAKMQLPQEIEYECYKGAAGEEFATEYIGFLRILRTVPNPDMILMNPDAVAVPTDPSVCYALCIALSRKATDNNIDRVLRYVERLQPEFGALLVRDAVKNDKSITHTKAYIQWCAKNAEMLM